MTSAVIEAVGLEKTYRGGTRALGGVDLAVHAGEVFALLGPNGAGKTTAVEILEGFRRRSAGEVRVLGEDPQSAGRTWRARVGVVLQSSGTSDDATVAEMVGLQAACYAAPRGVDDVLALVGLSEQHSVRVQRLSGGQQRRVDVACGIVGRPELLFLDEPTTGFDPEARRTFWELIRALRGEGTTILLTTHYLEEAEALADRIGVIAAGRMVAVGDPRTLGGRDRAASVVRWREGDAIREEHTLQPAGFVAGLAARLGPDVADLTVSRPTLESVYLDLADAARSGDAETSRAGGR